MVGNIKKNTKDDIITANSKSGMHIRADKKKTQFGRRFIRINDDFSKKETLRVETGLSMILKGWLHDFQFKIIDTKEKIIIFDFKERDAFTSKKNDTVRKQIYQDKRRHYKI
jgi:hypothetical protein